MERIRNIQQNLWQTKLFINHEIDAIKKQQDDLKSPTNKINKSAWVVNHKWRSLRTKKANPNELSDVDKYSQSLDKSRFFDAQDKIGNESEKFAAFLKYLRDKTSLVAVIFLTDGTRSRKPEDLSELIHALFSALYGFAILPEDERKIVRVLGDIAKYQIAEYQGPIASFFSSQTALSLAFRLYIEWSLNTRVYMSELMSDIVMNIIAEPEFLIVDEKKYQERHPSVKNLAKVRSKVELYRKRVATHVISMITQIRRHLHSFPPYLRWLGVSIVQNFRIYRGATQDEVNIFLGELFFTRMLFYPFLQPKIYLSNQIEQMDMSRHNLLQVVFTFREAFLAELGVQPSPSRARFTTVIPHIGHHTCEMVLLLEELVDVPYSSTVLPTIDIPVHRSAVLVTERDLHYVIKLLMDILASGKFQPEEKEMLATALSLLPSEPCRYLSNKKPGRKANAAPHANSKKNKPALPDEFIFEEEVLVFSIPGERTDKIKSESEVLGKNLDRTEHLFDDRKMSVLLTTEHPLETSQKSIEEDMKGRLLKDFDLLFHNPTLQLEPAFTPDAVSLSSATSYDSLDKVPCGSLETPSLLSTLTEDPEKLRRADTLTPSEVYLTPAEVHITPAEGVVTPSEEVTSSSDPPTDRTQTLIPEEEELTPLVQEFQQFNLDNLESSQSSSSHSDSISGSLNQTVLKVNLNTRTGGFFYEPSDSSIDMGSSSLSRSNSYPRFTTQFSDSIWVTEDVLPIDILSSEFVYQNQEISPPLTDKNVLQNAINKLKIAFSLFPHFYKSYYPKIGACHSTNTIDLISLSPNSGTTALVLDDEVTSEHKQLLEYLHSEYSDARLHNKKNAVQIEQAAIALKQLPPNMLPNVLSKLEEYNAEQADYIHYLMERKCELMRTRDYIAKVQSSIDLKHDFFYQTLASFVVENFLKSIEEQFREFRDRFKKLEMIDEKADVYVEYIDYVSERIDEDFFIQTLAVNHSGCDERECATSECMAVENHRNEVLRYAEINFFNSVYSSAFLPNGEAQKQKDSVYKESLLDLQLSATLNHPDIQIPVKYHYEAPWLPAQRHLVLMSAFRSPSGKLSCIMNCVFTIFKLLFVGASGEKILDGTTDDNAVPGADDLLPVLIYVIIHANPPNLLSTIDFIDNFAPKSMTGQDQYMLMQFRGAVEFIKSMLNRN